MDVCRSPRIVVIPPWIATGFDGHKAVAALLIGQSTTETSEIRIERGIVLILWVKIAARRIGLPELHQSMWDWTRIVVENSAGHNDSFAQRSLRMLARKIRNWRSNVVQREARPRDFGKSLWNCDERFGWSALHGRNIGRVKIFRLRS